MKIIVDSLPYYGDECPFEDTCPYRLNETACPRYWDKYKVCNECDEHNPRECFFLMEHRIAP